MTAQQARVFQGLVEGLSYKEIAVRLNIEARTVGFHAERIYRKYGVSSRETLLRKLGHFEVTVKWIPNEPRGPQWTPKS